MISTTVPKEGLQGFAIGAISTLVVSGVMNSKAMQEGKVSRDSAIRSTIKETLFGGVALGCATYAASAVGKKEYTQALTSVAIGVATIYGIESISQKLEEDKLCKAE